MSLENFPSNSRRPIEGSGQPRPTSGGQEPKLEKIEGIGRVVHRNKPLGRRVLDTFFRGEGSVISYLVMDVLVPAAQSLILDMVTQGLEKKFYGEVRTARRSGFRGPTSSTIVSRPHVGYDQVSRSNVVRTSQINAGPMRRPMQSSSIDPGDIILDTEFGAKMIVEKLYETLQEYGTVSVANLRELLGETPVTTDFNWGWVGDADFRVKRVSHGFRIDYPDPEDLRVR